MFIIHIDYQRVGYMFNQKLHWKDQNYEEMRTIYFYSISFIILGLFVYSNALPTFYLVFAFQLRFTRFGLFYPINFRFRLLNDLASFERGGFRLFAVYILVFDWLYYCIFFYLLSLIISLKLSPLPIEFYLELLGIYSIKSFLRTFLSNNSLLSLLLVYRFDAFRYQIGKLLNLTSEQCYLSLLRLLNLIQVFMVIYYFGCWTYIFYLQWYPFLKPLLMFLIGLK